MTLPDPDITETADVVVAGGGLAGLVAALTAAGDGRRVVLVDAHVPGGRARTDQRGGYTFNRGPRALYRDGAAARVLHQLGIPIDRGGQPAPGAARGLRAGRVLPMPHGPLSLLRTSWLSAGEKVRFGRAFAVITRLDPARFRGMSVDDALDRLRLGPDGTAAVRAVVRLATYSAATELLDAEAAFVQVRMGAGTGVTYLDGGWQTLVDELVVRSEARGVEIRSGGRVETVRNIDDGRLQVTISGGAGIECRTAVVATGSPAAAEAILGGPVPGGHRLGPPATAACLELGLRRPPTVRILLGLDAPLYLSTHCPPANLAPEGGAVVHVMRYLHHDDDLDHEVVETELRGVAATAGVADEDIAEARFLPRMVVTGGIPTGADGLDGRPAVEDPARPGVLLAGDWVGGEGMLADAAVASGARAGQVAADRAGVLSSA